MYRGKTIARSVFEVLSLNIAPLPFKTEKVAESALRAA